MRHRPDPELVWYSLDELEDLFSRSRRTLWRWLQPYRAQCRLNREGKHPRRVLLVPEHVVEDLVKRFLD